MKTATGQGKIYIRPIQRSLSVLPLKSEASPCSTLALKGKCVHKEYPSMYFAPMCCHAYLPIICYQMIVMKVVTLSRTIAALTSLENGQVGDNPQVQSENEEIHSNKSPAA